MTLLAWLVFAAAAILEVGGDAMIRHGLHARTVFFIVVGVIALGSYGLVVNIVKWPFSQLLGVYVAVFAAVSILAGRFVFKETIPTTTWLGLGLIAAGGLLIQFGASR